MMESLEMSESSSKEQEEPPPIPPAQGSPRPSPYKSALNKIERFLSTPKRRIGNNSVEPVLLSEGKKEPPPMDYPILTSSPFHFKRKDLLLNEQAPPSTKTHNLQTPSGASVGGEFASEDDDQQRLTSAGRSNTFSPPRLPCGLTNFHLSLFFGMIGFILFWLILLLRIYLPVDLFGIHPASSSSPPSIALHRLNESSIILGHLNESSLPASISSSFSLSQPLNTSISSSTQPPNKYTSSSTSSSNASSQAKSSAPPQVKSSSSTSSPGVNLTSTETSSSDNSTMSDDEELVIDLAA